MQKNQLIRPKDAAARAGISVSHLYVLVANDQFPQPIKISPRITAFVATEIDEWITDKIRLSRSGENAQ